MPDACTKILEQLSVTESARGFDSLDNVLTPGQGLPKPAPVFPRFVADED